MALDTGRKSCARRNQGRAEAARGRAGRPRPPAGVWRWCWWATIPASEIYVRNKMKACQDLGIYSETLTPPETVTTAEVLERGRAVERARRISMASWCSFPCPRRWMPSASCWPSRPGKGRGRLPPLQRRQPGGGPAGAARLHAGGHHRTAEALPASPSPASAPWWWAAATSSASPWPCCCCTSTPPSPSAIRRRPICRRCAARPISWWPPSGRAAMITARLHQARRHGHRRGHEPPGQPRRGGAHFPRFAGKAGRLRRNAAACWWATWTRCDVAEKRGAYTPVPGGVGPLTIAMLMANTVAAAERRAGLC